MTTVYKILNFLSLLDKDNNISITNVAVIIMVTKLMFIPTFTLAEVSAFVIVMLNYGHKRRENAKAASNNKVATDDVSTKLEDLESKVGALLLSSGLRRK